ncbi:MAG: type II toxin-antitoxin system VapC family toxin [Candidatus Poribacteria bacterium]|nr:type II toxin-antitoxin system VapC family toxin [Candidatus Poribacteria bacterium]
MIVLDTNVVSELMRDSPQQTVLAWFGAQPASSLFVTTVTEAEILTGIALLPYGRRRHGLSEAAGRVFATLFAERILVFDSDAANIYAEIYAQRQTIGRPISQSDCQIAAIARSREAAIATRNVTDFEDVEVELINPWSAL